MTSATSPDEIVAAFGRVANAIVSGAEPETVLTAIASEVLNLVDADLTTLVLSRPDGSLEILAAEGVTADQYRGWRFAPDGTNLGTVIATGEMLTVDDVGATYPSDNLPGPNPGPAVIVPVKVDGPQGAFAVMRLSGRDDFNEDEQELIRTFTDHAASMLEGDLDRRRLEVLDRIADHARIAQELNSSAVNELYNAGVTLSRVYNQTADDDTRELVLRAIEVLDGTIKMIRQAVFGRREDLD